MNTMQIMIELLREYIFKVGCACGNNGRLNTSVNISDVEYMIKIYEYLGCKELFVVLYIYYTVWLKPSIRKSILPTFESVSAR